MRAASGCSGVDPNELQGNCRDVDDTDVTFLTSTPAVPGRPDRAVSHAIESGADAHGRYHPGRVLESTKLSMCPMRLSPC
jgi:hypothetical protein